MAGETEFWERAFEDVGKGFTAIGKGIKKAAYGAVDYSGIMGKYLAENNEETDVYYLGTALGSFYEGMIYSMAAGSVVGPLGLLAWPATMIGRQLHGRYSYHKEMMKLGKWKDKKDENKK